MSNDKGNSFALGNSSHAGSILQEAATAHAGLRDDATISTRP